MSKYCVGVDFGTLSARALVADVGTGKEVASADMDYPHGVMDNCLMDGTPLRPDWALQHPEDYIECLGYVVPEALKRARVSPEQVVGMGIDFTSCTLMPVDGQGVPLCMRGEYAQNPHAYVKLWKHHAAQDQANRMNEAAQRRNEAFFPRYGGKISSEWLFPKVWQTLEEAPEIYRAADAFVEAADWVIFRLTGKKTRSECALGYKALYRKGAGFPDSGYFGALDQRLERVVEEKLGGEILSLGAKAGEITPEAARLTGLLPGTAVAVANVDAHVSVPAAGITSPGKLLMIIGTSTCHMALSEKECLVPGICGVVEDGVIPGLMGYEAGQSAVGDQLNWFVKNGVPEAYARQAREEGIGLHELLTRKASRLKPGESGLLALDWWNGNRSVLVDGALSGMILGMTLLTKPEEIYRALIESTAYGSRMIVENFREHGVKVDELVACGGIAQKNPFAMQIYADVLNQPIRVARSTQSPALGSAMFGAVAAGAKGGGYEDIHQAAREMGGVKEAFYAPNPESAKVYERLYGEYKRLHDYFGRGENPVMKVLRQIRSQAF